MLQYLIDSVYLNSAYIVLQMCQPIYFLAKQCVRAPECFSLSIFPTARLCKTVCQPIFVFTTLYSCTRMPQPIIQYNNVLVHQNVLAYCFVQVCFLAPEYVSLLLVLQQCFRAPECFSLLFSTALLSSTRMPWSIVQYNNVFLKQNVLA